MGDLYKATAQAVGIRRKRMLAEEILERRKMLPEKPAPVVLEGQYVLLRPLEVMEDSAELFAVSNGTEIVIGERRHGTYDADQLIWRYMVEGPFESIDDFAASLQRQVDAVNGLCMCVYDRKSGRRIGVVNFMSNVPVHLKIELGGIWYSPIAQKTMANSEATYLMLKHCFDLGYRRVEWKCDALNERSCRAALRLGFKFEGIQECHMIVKGYNRDTAWFRMLDTEFSSQKSESSSQNTGARR